MAVYQSNPLLRGKVHQATPGIPVYLLGSYNYTVAATRGNVLTVQLLSPTATVQLQVLEGQIPVVGQLINFQGVVPAQFNVTNAPILSVSAPASPDLGIYTVTFALTSSNVPLAIPSPGAFYAQQPETGDPISLGGTSGWTSTPAALQHNTGPNNGRSVRFDVSVQNGVASGTSVVATAQSAYENVDSAYQDILGGVILNSAGGSPASGSVVIVGLEADFVRIRLSGIAGIGTATILGTVLV